MTLLHSKSRPLGCVGGFWALIPLLCWSDLVYIWAKGLEFKVLLFATAVYLLRLPFTCLSHAVPYWLRSDSKPLHSQCCFIKGIPYSGHTVQLPGVPISWASGFRSILHLKVGSQLMYWRDDLGQVIFRHYCSSRCKVELPKTRECVLAERSLKLPNLRQRLLNSFESQHLLWQNR